MWTLPVIIPYSESQHRWWRLRKATGTLHWETSADGLLWTVQHSEPTPLDLRKVRVALASYAKDVAEPGSVQFNRYNMPPP